MIFKNDEIMRPSGEHEEHEDGPFVRVVDSHTARTISIRLEGDKE